MTETRKVLGQLAAALTTLEDVYTVPANTEAVVSAIVVCNRSTANASFRIAVAVAGAADANGQYLYYDLPISGNDTFIAQLGLTLSETDVVRSYASTSNLTVTVLGVEIA